MNTAAMKRQVKVESAAVREILLSWNPISGSPDDEYDCLVDHVVSALHKGQTQAKEIAGTISGELTEHFGITESNETIMNVAQKIAAYWRGRHT